MYDTASLIIASLLLFFIIFLIYITRPSNLESNLNTSISDYKIVTPQKIK
jgi:hypothetical protein